MTALIAAAVGVYESVTEWYLPAMSLLKHVHSYGYLKGYPIVYEPSKGIWHPLGWIGSAMMVIMMLYSVRKRFSFLSSLGSMRHWLSAHMFLGIMGSILVTLHTTFKLHGLIATSFWCMITAMVFGILGRYIYVQIPRSITGAELGVKDIENMLAGLNVELSNLLGGVRMSAAEMPESAIPDLINDTNHLDEDAGKLNPLSALLFVARTDIQNRFKIIRLKRVLKEVSGLPRRKMKEIVYLVKKKAALMRRKGLLSTSHRLLHYWHILHVPLAIVMFIIMFLHIIVYFIFTTGY